MDYSDHPSQRMPVFVKALLLIVVAGFTVLGLIGLVLPIIPGVVFLALAALLLSRVSSRFHFHLNNSATWSKLKRHWRSIRYLSLGQQVRLSFWLTARSMLNGMASLFKFASNKR